MTPSRVPVLENREEEPALLVASVGLYCALAFDVAERRREMGLRSAPRVRGSSGSSSETAFGWPWRASRVDPNETLRAE